MDPEFLSLILHFLWCNCVMHLTAKLIFDPNFTSRSCKCPQAWVTAHGLGHLGSEYSRNLSEFTLNLCSDQRAACYCISSFYHIFWSCSDWNIVYFVKINSRMFLLTLLKHNFHILQLFIERLWGVVRGCIHFIILSLFFVLGLTIPSNILPLTLRSHSYWFLCFYDVEWSTD